MQRHILRKSYVGTKLQKIFRQSAAVNAGTDPATNKERSPIPLKYVLISIEISYVFPFAVN